MFSSHDESPYECIEYDERESFCFHSISSVSLMWREDKGLEKMRASESQHGCRVVSQRFLLLRMLLAYSTIGDDRSVESCVTGEVFVIQQRNQKTSVSLGCFTPLWRGGQIRAHGERCDE